LFQANKSVFLQQLHSTLEEESHRHEERRRQDEEHNQMRKAKEDERAKQQKAVEDIRLEKQQIAIQKAKKLDELREKWVAMPVSDGGKDSKKSGRPKGRGKRGAEGTQDSDSGSDRDDDLFGSSSPAKTGTGAATGSSVDIGMFGSDDEDEANGDDGKNTDVSLAGKRRLSSDDLNDNNEDANDSKRLRKQTSDNADDDDNNDLFGPDDDEDEGNDQGKQDRPSSGYTKPMIADDDDDL
jgi:hypothetical protein